MTDPLKHSMLNGDAEIQKEKRKQRSCSATPPFLFRLVPHIARTRTVDSMKLQFARTRLWIILNRRLFFQSGLLRTNYCCQHWHSSTLQGRQRISNFAFRKCSHWTNWPNRALRFCFPRSFPFFCQFFVPSNFVSSLIPEGTHHLLSTLMWNGITAGE